VIIRSWGSDPDHAKKIGKTFEGNITGKSGSKNKFQCTKHSNLKKNSEISNSRKSILQKKCTNSSP
jgi:hypothetical protein